ncbi:hypothetical protein BTL55_08270 [Bordetella trematum]|uniref:amidase n=1 Tax=Bordetella trematum TaxID=123899 RepID=UPI000CA2F0DB|nr:amidase [Bordetella trematum]AUL46970.1 hypothetical protein BTL55_08270 [Bordetella trematum]
MRSTATVTARLTPDPLQGQDLAAYGRALRAGRITAVAATQAYLDRIALLDPVLTAYEVLAPQAALASAQAIDALLAAGTDLGPLMGVPLAVKDVLHVDGLPTRAGSQADVADLIGGEGPFVAALRRAGAIILGKTHTVEFAIGSTGVNYHRGTPRNPCDAGQFRLASGSSSGSAVAVAAGLCALAVGTDTGGSVRGPAAFCGVAGIKFSRDAVSRSGVFPMSRSFDSLGLLADSAASLALAWQALHGSVVAPPPPQRLRLGVPRAYFFEALAPEVQACIERALQALAEAGVQLVEIDFPELTEIDALYTAVARPELMASLGQGRFEAIRGQLNPDVAERVAEGLDAGAEGYLRARWRLQAFRERALSLFQGVDAWVAPVKQNLPPVFAGRFESQAAERALNRYCGGPTRAANALNLCGTSQPIAQWGAPLPVGLQLLCPAGQDSGLLAVAQACEAILGRRQAPDLAAFVPA